MPSSRRGNSGRVHISSKATVAVITLLFCMTRPAFSFISGAAAKALSSIRASRTPTITRAYLRHPRPISSFTMSASGAEKGSFPYRLYDSHLHVWTDGQTPPYTYAEGQAAPPGLQGSGTVEQYLKLMEAAGVEKSSIVQPILYLYDHAYVKAVLDEYPQRFKGMLNANPTLSPEAAVDQIRSLHKQGFGSIRFNPYIWPAGEKVKSSKSTGDS